MTGNPVSTHDYMPFGEEIPGTWGARGTVYGAGDGASQRFTGKERDSESGIDYFGARHFSGAQGRWTSPDVINLTSARLLNPSNTLNKYVYAANNPLKFIDPDGRDITLFVHGGIPASRGRDTGHAFLGVLNQATGQVKFLDYYPVRGGAEINQRMTVERLKEHASITIQTSPEVAQKAIEMIERLEKSVPEYNAMGNNCTTLCENVLRDVGLLNGDFVLPDSLWDAVCLQYGKGRSSTTSYFRGGLQWTPPSIPYQAGREFGNPRFTGFDYTRFLFDLYSNWNKPARGCVEVTDSASGTSSKDCE